MKSTGKIGNLVFAGISTGAAILILATLAAVAAFLLAEAWPAVSGLNARFSVQGSPEPVSILKFTLPQIFGTVLAAAIAMLITVPVSVGIALFISHYAPRGLAQTLGYLVDLLAAIPSVVYGLWGAIWLVPILSPIWAWLGEHMSWFPLFAGEASPTGRVIASASLILAVMILPIITSVSREVFLQTPRLHEEAALALGATGWEVVRMAVLPFGRSGIISASMLGLGRALGETAPLLITVGFIEKMNPNPLIGRMTTLPVYVYRQYSQGAATCRAGVAECVTSINEERAWAAALVLIILVMLLNIIARLIAKAFAPKTR